MEVAITGFGTVGQGVAEVVHSRKAFFKDAFGQNVNIVGAFDSSSMVCSSKGLDPMILLKRKKTTGKVGTEPLSDVLGFIREGEFDTLIDVTPTNIIDAQPGYGYIKTALLSGKNVITSSKGPLSLHFRELSDIAKKKDVELRYEASVGGAMPVINLSRELLKGEQIYSLRGILNGTCNFILHRMKEEGLPFDQALREAQEMGYAEADPSYDIDGVDSACKLSILANAIFGMDVTYADIYRRGIRGMTEEAIALAAEQKKVVRLIASISDRKLEVVPRMIPIGHPLSIGGTLNIVQIITDLAGDITVAGRGAGRKETASAVLSDIIALMKRDNARNGRRN